jgi:cbb3-type cytochrome oxidase maturation protein
MNILWFLLPLAFALSGLFLMLFLRAVNRGDYDTLDRDSRLPIDE